MAEEILPLDLDFGTGPGDPNAQKIYSAMQAVQFAANQAIIRLNALGTLNDSSKGAALVGYGAGSVGTALDNVLASSTGFIAQALALIALANSTVSTVAGNYDTLAAANAALGSIANGAGVNVNLDGSNSGFYVKESGVLVRKSTLTLPMLGELYDLTYTSGSGYYEARVDQDLRIFEGLDTTLTRLFQALALGPAGTPYARIFADKTFNGGDYAYAEVDDDWRMVRAIKKDGTIVNFLTPPAQTIYTYIVGIGDSLTAGAGGTSWPTQLAATIGRAVGNLGIGGQTSVHIARRVAQPTTIELSGNQIVSGANTVTKLGGLALASMSAYTNPYMMLSTRADNTSRSIKGTIYGVHGTLTRTASGGPPSNSEAYTFTPDAGYTLPRLLPSGYNFVPDIDATVAASPKRLPVCWLGRNNFSLPTMQQIIDDTRSVIQRYASDPQRFIVMSILNDAAETVGTGNWTALQTINDNLQTLFVDNFIDIREILIHEGLTIAGITPTAQDLTDIANDVIPSSLRADTTHLNTAGYGVVAFAINRFLTAKKWFF